MGLFIRSPGHRKTHDPAISATAQINGRMIREDIGNMRAQ